MVGRRTQLDTARRNMPEHETVDGSLGHRGPAHLDAGGRDDPAAPQRTAVQADQSPAPLTCTVSFGKPP